MSTVANSVAFLLASLFPSSLAVDLPTLFSPKNHDVAHVPTTSSVYSSVCPWVPFLLQLFLVLHRFLCSIQDIFNMLPNAHFKCFNPSYVTLLQGPYLTFIQCNTPNEYFDYAFFFRSFFLLKASFANATRHLISHSFLQSSVTILPR